MKVGWDVNGLGERSLRWMDEWMDRWMDRWMQKWSKQSVYHVYYLWRIVLPLSRLISVSKVNLMYFAVTDDIRLIVFYILGISTHESIAVTDAGRRRVDTHHCLHWRLHISDVWWRQYLDIVDIIMTDDDQISRRRYKNYNACMNIYMYVCKYACMYACKYIYVCM